MCSRYPRIMSVTNPIAGRLHDHEMPAVEVLLADGVPAPLSTIFAQGGVTIEQAMATQVTWWPGKTIVVRYRAQCSGALHGQHQIVACAGQIPEGAAIVERDGIQIGVWRVPHDPALPGLAPALDPCTASHLLRGLGMPCEQVRPRLRAYRPCRRAVVEVRGTRALLYLKVVPPAEVEILHRRHASLPASFPAPSSLGVDPRLGVLALEALPGVTLRQALEDPEAALPGPGDLEDVLQQVPAPSDNVQSLSPIERLPTLRGLLSLIVPGQDGRIQELAERIGQEAWPATVAAHGDFHEAQLLVERGRVVGVLDIDTSGWGRIGDDPATMVGHLAVLQTSSAQPGRVGEYLASLLRRWDRKVDPVDLRRRAAGVIFALATGPFRVQRDTWPIDVHRRLDLAEGWLDQADRIDERNLIAASGTPHLAGRS